MRRLRGVLREGASLINLKNSSTLSFHHKYYFEIFCYRFVKCEKCSHFFVVLSDADAKNRTGKGQMGIEGPEIQNAQQGKGNI